MIIMNTMERKPSSSSFLSKSLLFEQEASFLETFHHSALHQPKKSKSHQSHASKQYIPSDLHINDTIDHAIIDDQWNYISFTRYEDEPIIDYLSYAWVIRPTTKPIDYSEKFEIDWVIGKQFLFKYKTRSKKIERLIAEYPMIGAWCIGTLAAVISGTLLRFIHHTLDIRIWW